MDEELAFLGLEARIVVEDLVGGSVFEEELVVPECLDEGLGQEKMDVSEGSSSTCDEVDPRGKLTASESGQMDGSAELGVVELSLIHI